MVFLKFLYDLEEKACTKGYYEPKESEECEFFTPSIAKDIVIDFSFENEDEQVKSSISSH